MRVIAIALGIITAALAVAINVYVETRWQISLYSWFLFIIPAGAMGTGLVAMSGYYLGCLLFGLRPGAAPILMSVISAILIYIGIYYSTFYIMALQEGVNPDIDLFFYYWNAIVNESTLSLSAGPSPNSVTTPTLGYWGYLYEGALIVGLAMGGLIPLFALVDKPYCGAHKKYMKKMASHYWYTDGTLDIDAAYEATVILMAANDSSGALTTFINRESKPANAKELRASLALTVFECPKGDVHELHLVACRRADNEWKDISGSKVFQSFSGPASQPGPQASVPSSSWG